MEKGIKAQAKLFFQSLVNELREKQQEDVKYLNKLYYDGGTRYTNYIKNVIGSATEASLAASLQEGKREHRRELFRLDYSTYIPTEVYKDKKRTDRAEEFNIKDYCWNLDYAIEHENDPKRWVDEFFKLNCIEANLKILIAYYNYKERKSDKCQSEHESIDDRQAVLDFLSETVVRIQSNLVSENFVQSNYLIIFGKHNAKDDSNPNAKTKKSDYDAVWTCYTPFFKAKEESRFSIKEDWLNEIKAKYARV